MVVDVGTMLVVSVVYRWTMISIYLNPETLKLAFEGSTAMSGTIQKVGTPDARFRRQRTAESTKGDDDKTIDREGADVRPRCRRPINDTQFLFQWTGELESSATTKQI